MKTSSVLRIILILMPVVCNGQFYYSLQTGYTNEVTQIVPYKDQLLVLGHWKNGQHSQSYEIQKGRIEDDQFVWIDSLSFGGERMIFNYLIPSENGYYGMGFERSCTKRPKGNYLYELNDELLLITNPTKIEYAFRTVSDPISGFLLLDQSTAVFGSDGLVLTYDLTAQEMVSYNDQISQVDFLMKNRSGTFSTVEGKLFNIFDNQCNLLRSTNLGFEPKHIDSFPQGLFMAIGNNKLVVLSEKGSTLFEQNWSLLNPTFDSLNYSFWKHDTLHLIGKKGQVWVRSKMDRNFNIFLTDTIGSTIYEQFAFTPYNDQLLSGTRLVGALQKVDGISWSQTNPEPSNVYNLEIEEVVLPEVNTSVEGNSYKSVEMSLFVVVKNNSPDTVNGFFLNWKSSVNNSCEGQRKSLDIDRTIAPNEQLRLIVDLKDSFVTSDIDYEICIWSSSPGRQYDMVVGNDVQCISHYLPPLSIEKKIAESLHGQNLVHSGSSLKISDVTDDLWIELVGINGHSLSLPLINGRVIIPEHSYPGIYVLNIQGRGWRLSRKILVLD